MFLHQRANYANQKQLPRKINMHVKTSENEITSKDHIFSFKTKPSRAEKTPWKKQHFGTRSKLCVAYRPLFYMRHWLHSNVPKWQITILLTDDRQLQDKKAEQRPQMFVYRLSPFFTLTDFFTLFPKQRACSQANCPLVLERLVFIKCTYYTGHAWSLH